MASRVAMTLIRRVVLRMSNKTKEQIAKERIGATSISNQGYKMTVIDYKTNKCIAIQFDDEYSTVLENKCWSDFVRGKIKNPNHRTLYGVGYMGQGEHTVKRSGSREYQVWHEMLRRCYSRANDYERNKYKTYDGVTVCERWHCYQNFCEDLPMIEGYELWLNNPNEGISLDKDFKQQGVENKNKIYSLETCKFVSSEENFEEALYRGKQAPKPVVGVNTKTGKVIILESCREGMNLGYDNSSISKCCKGVYPSSDGKTYKSVTWYYKEDWELLNSSSF